MKLTWKTEYELEELETRLRETLKGKVPNPEEIQIFTDEFRNAIQGEEAIDTNTDIDANHIYATAYICYETLQGFEWTFPDFGFFPRRIRYALNDDCITSNTKITS